MSESNTPARANPLVVRGVDGVLSVQRPVVLAHIRSIRRGKPHSSPEQLIRSLERRYLATVTTGGVLIGVAAAVPAVGTGASIALSGAETAGFLAASALFAQSVTEVHGIALEDPERARTLVMTMVLGTAGSDLVRQLAGEVSGTGPGRTLFWGELVTKNLPKAAMGQIADRVKRSFLRRFAVKQSGNVAGRLIPFGIGAVVGGGGNHLLGRQIVRSSRAAFGPAPAVFPASLDFRVKEPRVSRKLRRELDAYAPPQPRE